MKKIRRLKDKKNYSKKQRKEAEERLVESTGEEIADTIIYLDLLAARLGINLSDAIIKKFNKVSDINECNHKLKHE